jgi:hypothetical protein
MMSLMAVRYSTKTRMRSGPDIGRPRVAIRKATIFRTRFASEGAKQ